MQASVNSVEGLRGQTPNQAISRPGPQGVGGQASFAGVLSQKMRGSAVDTQNCGLQFSRHAASRIESRGIDLTPDDLSRISRATDGAADKGARESLLLLRDVGMIINVKNRTVVTAMKTDEMVDRVFTNIDSTVFV